ncbi:uncharacterized protein CTRU02_210680 [Colletotrichum truncatum]|uniref:Uncharacterized protein n=1 Tax=Colletotrichum truncatum TaxID=5467 RepID=A0ACC3YPR5_COLTU
METPQRAMSNDVFSQKVFDVWRLRQQGLDEEAKAAAKELLKEPRLGLLEQVGLHIMLSKYPENCVKHTEEVVRILDQAIRNLEAIAVNPFTPAFILTERAKMLSNLKESKEASKRDLEKARADEAAAEKKTDKELDTGNTTADTHGAQVQELVDQEQSAKDLSDKEEPEAGSIHPSTKNAVKDVLEQGEETIAVDIQRIHLD